MRSSKFFVTFLAVIVSLGLVYPPVVDARGYKKKKSETKVEKQAEKASTENVEEKAPQSEEAAKASEPTETETETVTQEQNENQEEPAPSYKTKSPVLAGVLAFFPGILVHGSGHMYAGSWVKGLSLMAIEGAAIGVIVANIDTVRNEMDRFDGNKIPTNFGKSFTLVGVGVVSVMAFVWTWWDDIVGAPISAIKYNERQAIKNSRARFQLAPTRDLAGLGISLSKTF